MSIYLVFNKVIALPVVTTLVVATWAVLSLSHAPLTMVDLNRGERVFEQRCASCHSLDRSQSGTNGPTLADIGAVAANRVASQSAEQYLLQSIVDPNAYRRPGEHGVMPADVSGGLDAIDLTSLVGFLMRHGGSVDWSHLVALSRHAEASRVEVDAIVNLADVEAGKEIFFSKAKCHLCHPLRATPGASLRAPSLLAIGQHSTQYLRESIQHPSKSIVAGYANWSVWLTHGRVETGRLVGVTPTTVELIVESGGQAKFVAINREDIQRDEDDKEMLREMPQSLMPNNLVSDCTQEEFEQLLAFLKTLK